MCLNFLVFLVNNMCKNRNILLTAYGGMRACRCYNISLTFACLIFFSASMAITS